MGLALMDVITESMGIGNLIPAAQCDLQLTGTTKGLLTSTVFFGESSNGTLNFLIQQVYLNELTMLMR